MAFTPASKFFSLEKMKEREEFLARAKAANEVQEPSLADALESLDCLPTVNGIVYLAGPPMRGRRRG